MAQQVENADVDEEPDGSDADESQHLLREISLQSPPGDAGHRFDDDRRAHLRGSGDAFDEGDGHLDDAQAHRGGAPENLYLKAVPLALQGSRGDAAEGIRTERAEPAGHVALLKPEHEPRVSAAASREQATGQRPAFCAAAGDPAGSEGDIRVVKSCQQCGKVGRVVGAVGIHLDEPVEAALEAPGKACAIRGAQAILSCTMQHVDARVARREAVGQDAGAVG